MQCANPKWNMSVKCILDVKYLVWKKVKLHMWFVVKALIIISIAQCNSRYIKAAPGQTTTILEPRLWKTWTDWDSQNGGVMVVTQAIQREEHHFGKSRTPRLSLYITTTQINSFCFSLLMCV